MITPTKPTLPLELARWQFPVAGWPRNLLHMPIGIQAGLLQITLFTFCALVALFASVAELAFNFTTPSALRAWTVGTSLQVKLARARLFARRMLSDGASYVRPLMCAVFATTATAAWGTDYTVSPVRSALPLATD